MSAIADTVQSALSAKYGEGKWVVGSWDVLVYLNRDLIAEKKLDVAEVNRTAADALRSWSVRNVRSAMESGCGLNRYLSNSPDLISRKSRLCL